MKYWNGYQFKETTTEEAIKMIPGVVVQCDTYDEFAAIFGGKDISANSGEIMRAVETVLNARADEITRLVRSVELDTSNELDTLYADEIDPEPTDDQYEDLLAHAVIQ